MSDPWLRIEVLDGEVPASAFRTERVRDEFRHRPAVRAALDATPDPHRGLTVIPGGGDQPPDPGMAAERTARGRIPGEAARDRRAV